MAAEQPRERDETLRRALAPGKDCLPAEKLELCLEPKFAPSDLAGHVESCAYCRSQLDLLRSFSTEPRDAAEAEAVRLVLNHLQLPTAPARGTVVAAAPAAWWKTLFQGRWLSPAMLAAAAMLIAIVVGVQWRHGSGPVLYAPTNSEPDVMRSGSLNVIAPSGDVAKVPGQVEWQPVRNAARYQLSLLEVDRAELWTASTSEARLEIPKPIQTKIVPSKTLLLHITAFDNSGQRLAESEFVRFRLLQNVYQR